MKKMHEVSVWTIVESKEEGSAVLLRTSKKDIAIPIFILPSEVEAILVGLEGRAPKKPNTQNLLLDLLNNQYLSLQHIEIYDIKDNTYHAKLVIGDNRETGKNIQLDCGPGDALAMASSCKCRILVAAEVIETSGIPADYFIEAFQQNREGDIFGGKKSFLENKCNNLAEQLEKALEKEEYEKAAKLRDMMNAMDKTGFLNER
ncbi:MAG: DUF151 domain-containing protein [Treponema sp.]|nr:DUF151 domain-containing protein [Treponema sp.]